jgi:DNA repair exonuclease SbcCD ATPase subunit
VKIIKGVLHSTSKLRQGKMLQVKNRSDHDRTLLIEHPVQKDWKLVTPEKPTEQARDVYRFQLSVAAGQTAVQIVTEERTTSTTTALANLNDQTVRVLLQGSVASGKVKAALEDAVKRRTQLADSERQRATMDKQLADIRQDQERLRANLKEVPATSAAYKRYLEKFDKQETEIEKLQEEGKRVQETVDKLKKEYENFLAGLNVE